jgi:hypothetical protein
MLSVVLATRASRVAYACRTTLKNTKLPAGASTWEEQSPVGSHAFAARGQLIPGSCTNGLLPIKHNRTASLPPAQHRTQLRTLRARPPHGSKERSTSSSSCTVAQGASPGGAARAIARTRAAASDGETAPRSMSVRRSSSARRPPSHAPPATEAAGPASRGGPDVAVPRRAGRAARGPAERGGNAALVRACGPKTELYKTRSAGVSASAGGGRRGGHASFAEEPGGTRRVRLVRKEGRDGSS